ncbi:response regulator [Desulfonatronovibrio hydrogenovorans]|uniref:response regulator n=1 Tax=Desulfonatronovibrio hydrogenovorans TaxID=53245 RepID=UPI00049186E7|nr:response regulator [Desulfonatronovibrio hydrogenovorans]
MSQVDPRHLLSELKDNTLKKDSIKAGIVLSYLDQVDRSTQDGLLSILEQAEPGFCVPLLAGLIHKKTGISRELPRVREILTMKSLEDPELLLTMIRDGIEPRELFISLAAEARIDGAGEVLLEILDSELDEEILGPAITGLGVLGHSKAVNPVSEYLYSNSKHLIIRAIKALEGMGTPTAMHRLAEKTGHDHQMDILILDVFSRIQDRTSLERLNQAIGSHFAHLRTYAKERLVRIGPKAVPMLGENLSTDDPDLQIHTLNVLGAIGDVSALVFIRKLISRQPGDPNVRFAAFEALGMLPLDKGAYILARGLTDQEEHVCVAAASAIDRNLSEILVAGVRNMVRQKDHDAIKTVRAVINAQAKNLFMSLIEVAAFQEMAMTHLSRNCPPDRRAFFHELLQKYGYPDLAQRIGIQEDQEDKRPVAVAVDDSRMILNIYKATLYEMGFEPVLFEYPDQALEWIRDNRPRAVFTDLNMPGMTGIELTTALRQIFPGPDLPIIMVTTQNEAQDKEDALKAGVSGITFKPFTRAGLEKALKDTSRA